MSRKHKTIDELLEEVLVPEEEQTHDIPENWVWTKFGAVAKLYNGYAFKSTDYQEDGIPVIRISDISGEDTSPQKAVRVSSNLYNERFLIRKGDLLIAMSGATTGKTGVYNSDEIALQNQRVGNIKEISQQLLYPRFKNFYVFNISKEILKKAYGGAQPNISGALIEQLSFPLPPLNEQKRIAERLERLLNKIEEAKQLIEEANETFVLRTAAILDKAFHGDLTRKWRNKNSSLLQKSIDSSLDVIKVNNDFYNDFDLPSSWVWAKAESLFQIQPRNGYSPKSTEDITNTKTIKLGAITKGYFKDNEYKYIDETIDKESYLWLKHGDFLIQRANSLEYVGTAAIYTGSDDEFIYPDPLVLH
ncbi:restriction endonuclease subunit S [Cytobacillus firmus]|uniref:restriction endonuclease subunit S n=1 Tax=Cytobacillus firmus TaxID=1399 RepID=UPI0018CEAB09|nr:restriction endonuclease subunit S [Cytobacillus firmus]